MRRDCIEGRSISINGTEFTVERTSSGYSTSGWRIKGTRIIVRVQLNVDRNERARLFSELENGAIDYIRRRPAEDFSRRELSFTDGQRVILLGREFNVRASNGRSALSSSAKIYGNEISVALGAGLDEAQRAMHTTSLVRRLVSKELLPAVAMRVRELNERHFNFSVNSVRIRHQDTRWGSCSSNGNINISFRLLFAPAEIVDSVIIHELAHLRYRNHAGEFWDLVLGAMPDYRQRRKWLNANGRSLGTQRTDSTSSWPGGPN